MTPNFRSPDSRRLSSLRVIPKVHGLAEIRNTSAARDMQLHTDDAIVRARLTGSGKAQEAQFWLCGKEIQTVTNLLCCTAGGDDSVAVCCGYYELTTTRSATCEVEQTCAFCS